MKFKDILRSYIGVKVPIYVEQWVAPNDERAIAKKFVRDLENRQVLYVRHDMEDIAGCLRSTGGMREKATELLPEVPASSYIGKNMSAVRRAAIDFRNAIENQKFAQAASPVQRSILDRELTRLRKVVGISIGAIAIAYGLDVEDPLASSIPFNNM